MDEREGTQLHYMDMVRFQREEGGKWEFGLRFNNGDFIVDEYGLMVDDLWEYKEVHVLKVDLGALFKSVHDFYDVEEDEARFIKRAFQNLPPREQRTARRMVYARLMKTRYPLLLGNSATKAATEKAPDSNV